jgi:hypothetical protein
MNPKKSDYVQDLKWYRYLPIGTQVQHPKFGSGVVTGLESARIRVVEFVWEETIHAYDLSPEALAELAFDAGVDPETMMSVTQRQSARERFDIEELAEWVVAA